MPLFPQLGPEYYDESDRGILSRMSAFYAESISINQSFWTEADTDTRFLTGDQTVFSDLYGNLPANRRKSFCFNRIRRVVEMISGHQRRNRKSMIAIPIENADDMTADQFSKILMWCAQQEGILETVSDSFLGALGTGMNLLQVWLDFRNDPISGNIKVDNCSYNSFLIDPFFRKHDLSDCNAIWKRSFLTKSECASLLPDKTEQIMQLMGNDNRDGKFQFMPENYNYGLKNLLTYDEYYYRDYRKQKQLIDSQTGEVQEWRSDNEEGLRQFLQTYPQITVIEQEVPTVRLAIVVQGKVLYDGPNPLGIDQYPFIPVFAYYTPEMPYFPGRIQGVVRNLRDPQYLYNRRKTIELDILEAQPTSGWIYKENALVNPRDVYTQVGQGRGIALKDDAQMTDVQQIMAPQIPPSMIQLSELMSKEIQEISGVSEELLGSSDSDVGITTMLKQGAGLTTLQRLFDQLDRSQKILGKVMLDIIQANFTPGKVQKIIKDQPAPQFYNKAFGIYDCAIEEGVNTTTQKQMQLVQLLHLREMGIPIPDSSLVEALTVQDKPKLLEQMEQEKQQAMQQQQQQAQVAEQEAMSRIQLAQARAQADQGLGAERYSRIEENHALAVERRAAAEKDQDLALLNLVKSMKELDGMDINHLAQLVSIAKTLKDASSLQEDQQQVKSPM